ncbi:MAG: very short patch repair endonuclease [Gimesia sp.]|uniref:Very short patch repair endonuclease n=1 Tax=Gimesia maris TaxID=122 RepID=A0A3D3RE00_9PLAN|nr:very short patch repair endonuclease [Gimesia sp.]HCO27064.1 very short patch repair endonuclease [Gimesia maris]|tara:strand:- start:18702 stop:19178 length:477 start_codon:yes stop_codon:yes gene_type:complete
MADRISPEHRSWNMSRIKNRDTKPELIVRSLLHRMGYRFRLHRKDLPGKPDIVLPKYKTVIFVHGCFWHRHKGCKYAYNPKSRVDFWKKKFASNVKRDITASKELESNGWKVIIIWECETSDIDALARLLNESILHSMPYKQFHRRQSLSKSLQEAIE